MVGLHYTYKKMYAQILKNVQALKTTVKIHHKSKQTHPDYVQWTAANWFQCWGFLTMQTHMTISECIMIKQNYSPVMFRTCQWPHHISEASYFFVGIQGEGVH